MVPYDTPSVPVFDINIASLGLLGRSFCGTLGPDTNANTVYIATQIQHGNEPFYNLETSKFTLPQAGVE